MADAIFLSVHSRRRTFRHARRSLAAPGSGSNLIPCEMMTTAAKDDDDAPEVVQESSVDDGLVAICGATHIAVMHVRIPFVE